jgi:hypothetical protein
VKTLLLLPLLLLLPASGAWADGEREDPAKTFLASVGTALKARDAGAVARHFPAEGKVEVRLKRMKGGRYRGEQARSLLASWLREIEPKVVKLTEVRDGTVGVFETKYKVLADGSEVTGTLHVSITKEGESWRITGIVES